MDARDAAPLPRGPNLERPVRYPLGIPSADSLLIVEESLTREVQAYAESLAVTVPGLIARSYASVWRPGLIDRATTLRLLASQHLVWVQGITVSIDSSLAAAATSRAPPAGGARRGAGEDVRLGRRRARRAARARRP